MMGRNFRMLQDALLIILSATMLSCAKDSTGDPTPSSPGDEVVNKKMDAILRDRYLWNGEYVTLKPNYDQAYDTFLPSLLLNQMRTNILDRKYYGTDTKTGKDIYQIYSYVTRSPLVSTVQATRGVNHHIKKEATLSFGITSMTLANLNADKTLFGFVVEGVYVGSPAAEAGIKRGFVIDQVGDKVITNKNYQGLYYSITAPKTAGDIALRDYHTETLTKLTSKQLFTNPVLNAEVINKGAKKVGHIVYQSFDAAYDDELLAAIKTLKEGGANELILDLRINRGGHIISSNMLSTCIAGAACNSKVYQYYTYNATRMAAPEKTANETGNPYDSGKKLFYEKFFYGNYYGVDLRNYTLDLSRVFVLVSSNTASASEAVINSLKGIDFPITIIGEKTNGKNVGMEVFKLEDDHHKYTFAPITFQGFNAKVQTVHPVNGITPDHAVFEWENGLKDFTNETEPLFAKAMSLITGVAPAAMETRSDLGLRFVRSALPTTNLSHQGMIQLPPAER